MSDVGSGFGVFPYTYFISTNSGFTNIISSGATSETQIIPSIPDGTYYAKIQAKDLAGNISVSSVVRFTFDGTVPNAPTNVLINNGNVIDSLTQTGVTIVGSG